MLCKFCGAQMEDDALVCPVCGKQEEMSEAETPAADETLIVEQKPVDEETVEETVAEETEEAAEAETSEEETAEEETAEEETAEEETAEEEAPEEETAEEEAKPASKKASPGLIAALIACGVVIIALVVALLFGGKNTSDPTLGTHPANGNPNDATCKGTYTVSDQKALKAGDTVVAKLGDKELTNSMLQVFYWMEYQSFLSSYSNYLSYFGLDYTQPLDIQMCSVAENMTWQQYFLTCALETWKGYQVMTLEGEANGKNIDLQELIDQQKADMDTAIMNLGYTSRDELVQQTIGLASDEADYLAYVALFEHGNRYYGSIYETLTPTAEEVEAYFKENEATFAQNGVTKDSGFADVDVRHVLIQPAGGTKDENGQKVYADAAWVACEKKAQNLYNKWLNGEATEETFAELAKTYTADSNKAAGGLYEGVYEGMMVDEFNDWCFDKSRKPGDSGIVKTQFGYHIMYFVDSRDIWYAEAESKMISERAAEIVPNALENYDLKIFYRKIALPYMSAV